MIPARGEIATAGLTFFWPNRGPTRPKSRRSATASAAHSCSSSRWTGADLKAIIGFHPGLTEHTAERRKDSADIVGKVLVCVGADDPKISVEQRFAFETEMRAAGVDWRMNLYGGAKHSFTNPRAGLAAVAGLEYHRPSDERSWRAMCYLLDEVFT